MRHMTLVNIVEKMRDGRAIVFSHPGLSGFFYKAPYPEREYDSRQDGALSAVTYWEWRSVGPPVGGRLVMLLDDFDRDDWMWWEWPAHPSTWQGRQSEYPPNWRHALRAVRP